jgi:hypothetical protein
LLWFDSAFLAAVIYGHRRRRSCPGGSLVSLSLFYLGSLLPALHNKDITNTIGNW